MKGEERYAHVYSSYDNWYMDLDTDDISYSMTEADLDFIAGHFNHWIDKLTDTKLQDELFDLLGEMRKSHQEPTFFPEFMIYDFGGYGINSEKFVGETVEKIGDFIKVQVKYPGNAYLFIQTADFDKYSIELYEDSNANEESRFEYYVDSSWINYYMKEEDFARMNLFLESLVPAINEIYIKYGLPIIEE